MWNAATLKKYVNSTERSAQESAAKINGDSTAENLELIWASLEDEEKLFIEFLYLSEKRTAIALYEDSLFSGLLSKGLLQTPPGVGALCRQYFQTTYSIPLAVWEYLHDRPELFFAQDENMKALRLEELARHFNDRLDALLKGSSSLSDK